MGQVKKVINGMTIIYNAPDEVDVPDKDAMNHAIGYAVFRDNYKKEELASVKRTQEKLGGIISWRQVQDNVIYRKYLDSLSVVSDENINE